MSGINWKAATRPQGGAILMIVLGALLALSPDSASALVSVLLGWGLIVVGVMLIVGGFISGGEWGAILQGALFLICGSWLHRNPMMVASILGVVVGITAIRHGWRGAKNVQKSKRSGGFWIPGAVLSALELLVGVRLILSPLSVSRLLLTIAGIAMVACGAWELISRNRERKVITRDTRIIDADK